MHNYVVSSPEQTAQQHGSSNQASINNILQRPNTTTRTMPHEFTLDQGNHQSAKRRKSGGGNSYVNPSHPSDQAYMQQGSYHFVQQPTIYFSPIPSINQQPAVTSSRNNNNVLRPQQPLGFADALSQRSQSHTISNNNIFNNNNSDKPQALQTSNQVISNQNNHHVSVSSQIMPQQIGFQSQIQISNNSQQQMSQQQILQQHGSNQGQMQQISLEMLRPSTSGQITLYPIPQIQQTLHTTTIMDSQLYNNDNIPTSNISSTQEPIIQRLESLKVDLENKDFYQNHCEELYTYLQNESIYSICQDTLIQCLRCKKPSGLWF
ncbi:hypothetical protein RclHR1_04920004 [Rhizophagus clarus]|uniref:Uncharacterized protein n=1 Tax=Rhizophagus clarus TaxID=94130 RepID=A0A2Z6RX65_9GLOM|nr:hypothetical protein RclHR1_04920004 [Rhizophagus clarus]